MRGSSGVTLCRGPSVNRPKTKAVPSPYFESKVALVSYWLYFDDRAAADEAADGIRAVDLSADVEKAAKGKNWLVLAYKDLPDTADAVEQGAVTMRAVASSLRGEYDGWEAGPLPDMETADRIKGWLESGVGKSA